MVRNSHYNSALTVKVAPHSVRCEHPLASSQTDSEILVKDYMNNDVFRNGTAVTLELRCSVRNTSNSTSDRRTVDVVITCMDSGQWVPHPQEINIYDYCGGNECWSNYYWYE